MFLEKLVEFHSKSIMVSFALLCNGEKICVNLTEKNLWEEIFHFMKKVNGIFLQNELLYALEADLLFCIACLRSSYRVLHLKFPNGHKSKLHFENMKYPIL